MEFVQFDKRLSHPERCAFELRDPFRLLLGACPLSIYLLFNFYARINSFPLRFVLALIKFKEGFGRGILSGVISLAQFCFGCGGGLKDVKPPTELVHGKDEIGLRRKTRHGKQRCKWIGYPKAHRCFQCTVHPRSVSAMDCCPQSRMVVNATGLRRGNNWDLEDIGHERGLG